MKESYTSKRRVRKNFGRIDSVSEMPSLIEVQTGSYRDFIENKNCEFGLSNMNSKSRSMTLTNASNAT
mgnify:CR=1 FL=1